MTDHYIDPVTRFAVLPSFVAFEWLMLFGAYLAYKHARANGPLYV